jgi:glycosyltransferase involved in cell wall biosynthesis
MKISVVIPTYQRPELLMRCLHALSEQEFEKDAYEVIVVSDGPDELTKHIADAWNDSYETPFRYVALPVKKGPAAARNAGWRASSAPLIAFTDDDCMPDKRWLQQIYDNWQQESEIAYTGRIIVPLPPAPTDFERNTANLETAEFVTANCVCTRAALEKIDGFDERFEAAWREDSDLEFRLLLSNTPIRKLSDAVVVHPVRKAHWGVSIKEQRKNIFNALLYKKFPALYRKKIQQHPAWNYYIMLLAVILAIGLLIAGYNTAAIAAFSVWGFLSLSFIIRRLAYTRRSWSHIWEMIITSIAIPFVAIYWSLRGAVRYKVWYL